MLQELIQAIKEKKFEEAKVILSEIDPLKYSPSSGYTALDLAAENNQKELCELILNKFPESLSIYPCSEYGQSALHTAAKNGSYEVCEFLISKMNKSMINAPIIKGIREEYTALHFAAEFSTKEVCELLVPHINWKINKSITIGLNRGETIFHVAARNEDTEVWDFFIQKVAPETITKVNNFNQTALNVAANFNNIILCKHIYNKYPDLICFNKKMEATFNRFAKEGKDDSCKELLKFTSSIKQVKKVMATSEVNKNMIIKITNDFISDEEYLKITIEDTTNLKFLNLYKYFSRQAEGDSTLIEKNEKAEAFLVKNLLKFGGILKSDEIGAFFPKDMDVMVPKEMLIELLTLTQDLTDANGDDINLAGAASAPHEVD